MVNGLLNKMAEGRNPEADNPEMVALLEAVLVGVLIDCHVQTRKKQRGSRWREAFVALWLWPVVVALYSKPGEDSRQRRINSQSEKPAARGETQDPAHRPEVERRLPGGAARLVSGKSAERTRRVTSVIPKHLPPFGKPSGPEKKGAVKDFLEQHHGFFGGEGPPYFAETHLPSLASDLCLKLVDLTEYEHEIGINDLPFPVVV